MLNTPILFIIFNRVDLAKTVFDKIRAQRPVKLFIAADGPRPGIEMDRINCEVVRKYVLDSIDWECQVYKLFRETNLGCGRSVSSAISWFFDEVEEGIILEDDCVPNEHFFKFCETLLQRYRSNHSISAISGNNFQPLQPMLIEPDYYFSVFPSSWGWATWRRAWTGFDLHISDWPTARQKELESFLFQEKKYSHWWKRQFDHYSHDKVEHTWDFQFHYLSMSRNQLAVLPKVNLVSNIGTGDDATHFKSAESELVNMPTFKLSFPLKHPKSISRNYEADLYHQKLLFGEVEIHSIYKRFKKFVKRVIRYRLF
ncbi:hemolytic protein HlpA [Larkinella harenae]